jgi:hypothetical protein
MALWGWLSRSQYLAGKATKTSIADTQFKGRLKNEAGLKAENRLFIYKMEVLGAQKQSKCEPNKKGYSIYRGYLRDKSYF